MNRPKFAVGEEVILVSRDNPSLNGEYVVAAIVKNGDTYKCRISGEVVVARCESRDVTGYFLDDPIESTTQPGYESAIRERLLRKKHQPGQSFQSLMTDLNNAKPKLLEKK